MRHRKPHGLAGSPEHHAKAAMSDVKQASVAYKQAAKEATKGRCESAMQALFVGVSRDGAASAHDIESGGAFTAASYADKAYFKALDSFRPRCLMPDGLRSPRRRRK